MCPWDEATQRAHEPGPGSGDKGREGREGGDEGREGGRVGMRVGRVERQGLRERRNLGLGVETSRDMGLEGGYGGRDKG